MSKTIDRNDAGGPEVSEEAKIMLDVGAVLNTVYLDIPYHSAHPLQTMDILIPNNTAKPYPLMVYIHGGGWFFGDKRNIHTRSALKMAQAGYAVASINYRLSGENKWPAQIYDCKAAIRFLRANGEKYGINTERIAVWGNSAGGHLAAMLAVTGGLPEFEDMGMGNRDYSSSVEAVIVWFGGFNLTTPRNDFVISKLFGYENSMDNPLVCHASPINHMKSGLPPMMIQHGLGDTVVSAEHAKVFYDRYIENNGTEHIMLDLFKGQIHSGDMFHTDSNLRKISAFLDQHIRQERRSTPPVFCEYPEIR